MKDMDKRLEAIAKDYHYYTESYDRLVCSGVSPRGRHLAMPRTEEENKLIQKNAYECRNTAIREGAREGFTAETVMRAINDVAMIYDHEFEKHIRNKNYPPIKSIKLV